MCATGLCSCPPSLLLLLLSFWDLLFHSFLIHYLTPFYQMTARPSIKVASTWDPQPVSLQRLIEMLSLTASWALLSTSPPSPSFTDLSSVYFRKIRPFLSVYSAQILVQERVTACWQLNMHCSVQLALRGLLPASGSKLWDSPTENFLNNLCLGADTTAKVPKQNPSAQLSHSRGTIPAAAALSSLTPNI